MTLMEIRNHMMQVRITTLANLCRIFNANPDTLRCMLSHWVNKGKIRQCTRKPACGSKCFKCPTDMVEMYEWVDGQINCITR